MRLKSTGFAIAIISLTSIYSIYCPSTFAQSRLSPDKVIEKEDSRPGVSVKKTTRFQTVELNQRFGIQQVGEVMADTVSPTMAVHRSVSQPETLFNEASQLSKTGKYDRAVPIYQKAIKLQPGLIDAHQGLGYALIQLNDFPAAIEQYREVIAHEPENAEAQLNLGVALYRSGKISDAIEQYQHALSIKKDIFPSAHFNLAMALAHNGESDKAIEHYQTAIEQRKTGYAEAHNNLGLVYEALGNDQEAGKQFMLAIQEKHGSYPIAHYNLSRIYQNQRNTTQAIASLNTALKQQSDFPEAHLNLGNIYLIDASLAEIRSESPENLAAKLNLAITQYRQAIAQREGFYPLAHEELAIALIKLGKHNEGLAEYRQAFDQYDGNCPATLQNLIKTLIDQPTFSVYDELSRADNAGNLSKKHDEAAARETLRQILIDQLKNYDELDDNLKDSADVRYCAGRAYMAAGKWKPAVDEFARAVELSGGKDEDAAQAIKEILMMVNYF